MRRLRRFTICLYCLYRQKIFPVESTPPGKMIGKKERAMDILVIGGGPAGMMAAIFAKREAKDREVVLFEKNEKLGKKLSPFF